VRLWSIEWRLDEAKKGQMVVFFCWCSTFRISCFFRDIMEFWNGVYSSTFR